jgi:hypothetical protein
VGPKEAVLFIDLHTPPIFLAHHINPHVHICIYNLYIFPIYTFFLTKMGLKTSLIGNSLDGVGKMPILYFKPVLKYVQLDMHCT